MRVKTPWPQPLKMSCLVAGLVGHFQGPIPLKRLLLMRPNQATCCLSRPHGEQSVSYCPSAQDREGWKSLIVYSTCIIKSGGGHLKACLLLAYSRTSKSRTSKKRRLDDTTLKKVDWWHTKHFWDLPPLVSWLLQRPQACFWTELLTSKETFVSRLQCRDYPDMTVHKRRCREVTQH